MYRDPELLQADREGLLRDEYWNPYDPYNPFPKSDEYSIEYLMAEEYGPFWDIDEGDFDSEHDAHLRKIMDDIIWSVSNKPLNHKELIDQIDTERLILDFEKGRYNQKFLLGTLQAFLNNIHSARFRRHYLSEYIKHYAGHPLNILTLYRISSQMTNTNMWKLLLLFSPFWIRSPLSWREERGISLVEHLFVRYETPEYLYKIWNKTDRFDFTWLAWFLIIARGGSLKKAAHEFGWRFTSKNFQYLFEADESMTPLEAYIYAEIKRMKGSDRVVNLILDCPPLVIDLTNPSTEEDFIEFWKSSVQWLIQNENGVTDVQANHVLDWAMHEFTDSGMRGNRRFSWRGRSLEQVLDRSAEYQRTIWRPYGISGHGGNNLPLLWETNDLDWEAEEENGDEWSFTELNNSKELHEEGRILKHCVGGYSYRCIAGNSAIVSLKKNGKRIITIELNPGNKSIIQAHGKRNRTPDEDEMKIIRKWLKNCN